MKLIFRGINRYIIYILFEAFFLPHAFYCAKYIYCALFKATTFFTHTKDALLKIMHNSPKNTTYLLLSHYALLNVNELKKISRTKNNNDIDDGMEWKILKTVAHRTVK